jgi:predicted small secreted protein
MKRTLRTIAAATALALALFGLTACDTDDDCEDDD